LGYKLFADVWLDTNVVESLVRVRIVLTHFISIFIDFQVYDGQSNFLNNVPPVDSLPGNETSFDLPVEDTDTDAFITVSGLYFFSFDTPFADLALGWNLFVAAMTPNNDLRANRISRVHNRALLFGNQSIGAFLFRYDSSDGSDISGIGRRATSKSLRYINYGCHTSCQSCTRRNVCATVPKVRLS
jgi:hypothetical protein